MAMQAADNAHSYDREIGFSGTSGRSNTMLSQPAERNVSCSVPETNFGYYAELSVANCVKDFKKLISHAVARLGFEDFVFTRFTEKTIDPNILLTTPITLLTSYFEAECHRHDMVLKYVDGNKQPVFRSMLQEYAEQAPFDSDMKRTMIEIYNICKSHGYYDFYLVPYRSMETNSNVILSVTSRGCNSVDLKRKVKGVETTLKLLCEAIDFVAVRKFPEILAGGVEEKQVLAINPRPLRVLDMLANSDLNISQVADKLCISTVTANKHLDTIRKTFGVKTNHAAIRKAVTSGIIQYRK